MQEVSLKSGGGRNLGRVRYMHVRVRFGIIMVGDVGWEYMAGNVE